MKPESAEILIAGAGIAGVAAAWALAGRGAEVLLVDERPPLSLTSDKSTECYRNFWPGPDDAMVRLMNRSIDILERLADESGDVFGMNRRGYLYATADPARVPLLRAAAAESCSLGAGTLRVHDLGLYPEGTKARGHEDGSSTAAAETPGANSSRLRAFVSSCTPETYRPAPPHGYHGQPDGADLILDRALIRRHFPYLSERVVAVLHARRCGWLSAQQLGAELLSQARERGVRLLSAAVEGVEVRDGAVQAVHLRGGPAPTVRAGCFVNAAGPMVRQVGRMLGAELPVFSERHLKLAFEDRLGAIPRDAPLLIWADPVNLPWSEEERALLAEAPKTRRLLETLPPGAHARPEGGGASRWVLALWAYDAASVEEVFPLPEDEQFAEVALRGVAEMIPGLRPYVERPPRPVLDGGYYTKTRENRPLIGPLPVRGAHVLGALSGFGVMAACGAAELLAAHIEGVPLPPYAPAFHPARYQDPAYLKLLDEWRETGQL
ncbi:MAG TPA: FAD-dependent oxidoreductase [Roseiflexaceae bacterium]|nr:FAD-dependent oxidoreductase [Roseiflexaceae bacterium]